MSRQSSLPLIIVALLLAAILLAIADRFILVLGLSLLIFAGLLFGVFVHAISDWPTQFTRLPYRYCYLIVVTLLLLLVIGGFYYLGSVVAMRADELWTEIIASAGHAEERLTQYQWMQPYLPDASSVESTVKESGDAILPTMVLGLRWAGWGITGALVIFFVGLYAAYEPSLYRDGLLSLVADPHKSLADEVLDELRSALGHWIIGRLTSMAIVGIATAIALSLLGVPLPMTLGVLAALLTFIPNIGPLLAAVPQLLLALNLGANTLIAIAIFNLALQSVESYLITPVIQRREVSLPPILTIFAQLLMGALAGIIGVMMAAPLVVVLMVLVQEVYVESPLRRRHT